MKEQLTTMTRKGQITVPAEIRRALNLREGDKVAVSLDEDGTPRATLRPIHSVTDMTFGMFKAHGEPEDMRELRRTALEEVAENAASEGL